jgi:type I restriction enzyme S subunit
LQVPLPPLDEQRRIVDILNHASSIRRLREQAQAKAREIIPALFLDMFGDPATNPRGWEVGTVGDILTSAQYGTSTKAAETRNGMPMLRMGNVTTDGALSLEAMKYVVLGDDEIEKYSLRAGDILFNRTNSRELVGKTGLWDGRFPAVHASYFIRLRVDRSHAMPEYVWAFFNGQFMKRRLYETARGAIGQANINAKEVRAFSIPLPPLNLQEDFAVRVSDVQSLVTMGETACATANSVSQSLLNRCFNGENPGVALAG